MMLHKETFPGQLPYRCLLAGDLENLLVPVCLSTTHVAWGAVRLEPTWMQIGESAAYAILQAMEEKLPLQSIDTEKLVRRLAEKRSMVTFFNDFYVDGDQPWIPAVQYFGTKGFFPDYDAGPEDPLDRGTAEAWIHGIKSIVNKELQVKDILTMLKGESDATPVSRDQFNELLQSSGLPGMTDPSGEKTAGSLSRAEACLHLYCLI